MTGKEIEKYVGAAVWQERKQCARIVEHSIKNPRLRSFVIENDWGTFIEVLAEILFDRPDPRQLELPFVRP